MTVRTRGRASYFASAGVQDIYNEHIWFSGLYVGRLNPGQPATCSFTISHTYGLNYYGGTSVTVGGVLLGPDGLAISLMSTDTFTHLNGGDYISASLYSMLPVPVALAGQTIQILVGDARMFGPGVTVGEPFTFSSTTMLSVTATVPLQASGPPTLPTTNGGLWSTLAWVGGGLVLLGGGAALIEHKRGRLL